MRILLVDDEDSLLLTLAANLELEGFDVTCASGGHQALSILARQRFNLVLSDVRMPGMNGVELFRKIRDLDDEVPVLLMTAFAVETLIEEAIAEGVFTVLPKPFEIEHVIAAVLRASRRPAVLLVDDTSDARGTALAVSQMGVSCRASAKVADVLASVRRQQVDVCVVDVASAASEDAELVARILETDGTVAVIAVATDAVAFLLHKAAALGAFACLQKPFRAAALVHVVASARGSFRKRGGAAAGRPAR